MRRSTGNGNHSWRSSHSSGTSSTNTRGAFSAERRSSNMSRGSSSNQNGNLDTTADHSTSFQRNDGAGAVPRRQGPDGVGRGRGRSGYQSNQQQQNGRGYHYNSSSARDHHEPNDNSQRKPYQKFPLSFTILKRLTDETTEPSELVKKFTDEECGLQKLLRDNPTNWEFIELILVALGGFCQRGGNSQFSSAFSKIIIILRDGQVFQNVFTVFLQIPQSRSDNLGTKEKRLVQLVESISYLATEMLTQIPALACDVLGENFFGDIVSLKMAPSIRSLDKSNVFDSLQEVTTRLKNAWEQNARTKISDDRPRNTRAQRAQMMSSLKPPDDFRLLSVMPTPDDMYTDEPPFLRPNVVKGNYPDVDSYLDVQFRLLREDFFQPLRKGLSEYRGLKELKKRVHRIDNVRLYTDVKILELDLKAEDTYTLQFSTKGTQKINWEGSKRLIFGSLLLLSADDFKTFLLFTVVDRKPELLQQGKFKAKYEGTEPLPPGIRKQLMVMAESSVYFEAYRCVLQALQKISPNHFPMKPYILGENVEPNPPRYLDDFDRPLYDLSVVRTMKETPPPSSDEEDDEDTWDSPDFDPDHTRLSAVQMHALQNVAILEGYRRPEPDILGLDPSQTEALYAALTRELVVIQGPPGTGKTYLGLKIVQALLHNKKYWIGTLKPQPSPILVICYTNHALDQFLEGIMGFTRNIVRIGGQSKCEAMQQFALKEWRTRASQMRTRPAKFFHWLREARAKLDELKSQLDKNRLLVKSIETKGIAHEESLYSLKVITKEMYDEFRSLRPFAAARKSTIETDSVLPYWLGLDSIQILNGVMAIFRSTKPVVEEAAKLTFAEDEALEEDEWDREDVDEIEGQRIVEGLMDLGLDAEETKRAKKPAVTADTSVRFAVTMHGLEEYCWGLVESRAELEGRDLEKVNSQIAEVQKRIELISELLVTSWPEVDEWRLASIRSDYTEYALRWREYLSWRSQAAEVIEGQVGAMEVEFRSLSEELRDVQTTETAEIIRGADVVGITTTGAAKQKALLEHLKCKIVVVEEAAEVLEAHIITSLSSSCQHLILIGDHLQLRPTTTVFELARIYKLDVSLFERMIENGMRPCVLGVQHRMRPEVARLIVPAIYPELKNHQSVERYPNVPGMKHNVFFLTHSELEKGDKSDVESRSHLNPYEADMALALARHLLMQGLQPSQITILTTYSGQLLHFRKIRRGHAVLQGVRISVVDNFQGEENDIIILSLVRSNEDANIGFLKTENRICVALSRAKQGFFLIGNMENLAQSKLWSKINAVLARHGQMGTHLELRCGVHHYIEMKVNKVIEFPPEGGCFTKCKTPMPCGHICPRICHVADRDHVNQKCHEACQRSCGVGHPCPKKCYEDCHPCLTRVIKTLPCTHSQQVLCFKDPKEEYCTTQVIKKFPTCTHQIELHCGRDIMKEKCPEKCGMNLDCGHICNLSCHKRSSHENINCRQPCRRTPCPEKHPCPKECFQDCGDCQVDVVKKLPCGHDKKVKCYMLPKDAYCNVKVEKILNDCQHTVMFDCSASTAGYQCRQACQRPLCADGHPCKKLCWVQPCGPCNVQVDRVLGCGHPARMECHRNPAAHRCKIPKSVVLPLCNHRVEIACGDKPEEAICPIPCDIRLDCGHQCTQQCHIKKDPTHANYRCTKVCGRNKLNCKQDHKCGKKCFEECDPCKMNVHRKLPCGHFIFTECGLDDKEIFCEKIVKKTIPECGHEIDLLCSKIPTRQDCQQRCEKRLSCGHPCGKNCSAKCSAEDCVVLIETNTKSLCGHQVLKSCSEIRYRSGPTTTEDENVQFLQACPKPCRSKLGCEHLCNGECGSCFNGRLHTACEEKCGRTLVCGHSCKVNCASSCPPCKEVCQYRCAHSRCSRKCCEPCENCIEPCGWRCKHYKCTKKCYEPCDRPRCDEPCQERLRCGHPCVGLCGEKCPPLCRICNKDELTEFILYGNEEDEDARFVYLEDCKHTIEVDGLDHWMQMAPDQESGSEIKMKCCPRCKTLISSCYRYGNVIKGNFMDIIRVKEMLLDSQVSAQAFINKLTPKILKLKATNAELKPDMMHHSITITLTRLITLQKKLEPTRSGKHVKLPSFHEDEKFMLEVQVDVLERLFDVLKNAPKNGTTPNQAGYRPIPVTMKAALLENIYDRAERLILSLFNRDRISTEEHQSFIEEIRRLDLVRALFMLRSAPNYHSASNSLTSAEDRILDAKLLLNIKKLSPAEEAQVKTYLEAMSRKLNTGLGISDQERKEVVRAIGLGQGHWYKCPNGHIFAIANCGQPNQQGTCPECKARIGGGGRNISAREFAA